jgi:hypothetical protein
MAEMGDANSRPLRGDLPIFSFAFLSPNFAPS